MANLQRLYEAENNKAKAEQEDATQFLENIKKKQSEKQFLLRKKQADIAEKQRLKLN